MMRKSLSPCVIGMMTLALSVAASARTIDFASTIGTKLGFGPVIIITGAGVATQNGSQGGIHLSTLKMAPTDPMDSPPVPVTDPETTGTIASNIVDGAAGRGGMFFPISGGALSIPLIENHLPLGGVARVCIVFSGCANSLPLILTQNQTVGVGVGGIISVGFPGPIRISLINSPWQLNTATRIQSTANGVTITRMHHGFVHGPNLNTSSTAVVSGVVQLITPSQVITKGIAGNTSKLSLFTSITIRFLPEPGLMLVLGSGVIGLVLLGRGRMRQ